MADNKEERMAAAWWERQKPAVLAGSIVLAVLGLCYWLSQPIEVIYRPDALPACDEFRGPGELSRCR